jgi:hypothetical protein
MIRLIAWTWLPWLVNRFTEILSLAKRVTFAAYSEATVKKEILFVNNLTMPILSSLFTDLSKKHIRWSVTIHPPRFTDPNSTDAALKHISYLGLSINIPGHDPIDLTDWINEVMWSGTKQPCLTDIFIVWCFETKNPYFHYLPFIEMEVISKDGLSVHKGLNELAHTIV